MNIDEKIKKYDKLKNDFKKIDEEDIELDEKIDKMKHLISDFYSLIKDNTDDDKNNCKHVFLFEYYSQQKMCSNCGKYYQKSDKNMPLIFENDIDYANILYIRAVKDLGLDASSFDIANYIDNETKKDTLLLKNNYYNFELKNIKLKYKLD